MTGEFGGGEHNERREDETDELQELRDRIRARGEKPGDEGQERNEADEFRSYVEHLRMKYGPGGGGEAERAPAPEQRDRAQGESEVGAYQREQNDNRLEQQSARSETKREGVPESPERANDSVEAADPARVGESPKLREVKGEREASLDRAGVEGRAQESETVEGRAETPQPHESVAQKTHEESPRPERGVAAAAVAGADQRQAYPERSAVPSKS